MKMEQTVQSKTINGKQKLLFYVLLICGLNEQFADCLLEYTETFSDEEIRFEMQIFKVVENECLKININRIPIEWWQEKIRKHPEQGHMLERLRTEIFCFKTTGDSKQDQELAVLGSFWLLQFLTLKISFFFFRGHLHYKNKVDLFESDNEIKALQRQLDEKKAASLARSKTSKVYPVTIPYLRRSNIERPTISSALKIRDTYRLNGSGYKFSSEKAEKENPKLKENQNIAEKFFQQIHRDDNTEGILATADHLFDELTHMISKCILKNYNSTTGEINMKVYNACSGIEIIGKKLEVLDEFFGKLLFGGEPGLANANKEHLSDEKLWESASKLIKKHAIQSNKHIASSVRMNFSFIGNEERTKSKLIAILQDLVVMKAKLLLGLEIDDKSTDSPVDNGKPRSTLHFEDLKKGFQRGSRLDLEFIPDNSGFLRFLKKANGLRFLPDGRKLSSLVLPRTESDELRELSARADDI